MATKVEVDGVQGAQDVEDGEEQKAKLEALIELYRCFVRRIVTGLYRTMRAVQSLDRSNVSEA